MADNKIYKHITSYYQALLDKGLSPEVARELTVQQVAEGGYNTKWWTGDKVKYNTPEELAAHVIEHHSRMFPDSLKATNFNEFYDGLQKTGKAMYNSVKGYNGYKQHLLTYRPGIIRRINQYEQQPTIKAPVLEHIEPNDVTNIVNTPVIQPIQMKKCGGKLKRHIKLK